MTGGFKMATKIYQCMQKISDAIVENKDFLTDLDREIGDADHGVNMARGFTEVMKQLPEDEEDYGVVLKKVGMVLLSKVGGASGPLYGTAYMKAGAAVKGKTSITLEDAKAMLTEVIGGIKMRGKAVKGEKTMLDALEPALDALTKGIENGDDAETCLNAMCEAAREGVEFTKTIRATKGRASYLGDRSIGHQDPGATSATITLEAIRDFYLENK
jgi:dihydroxyacetone kinase-like protein